MQRRRSGFRDFLEGFNGTYELTNKIMRDIDTTDVMNEKPQNISSDQLTDDEYAAQQQQGPVNPSIAKYDGKIMQRAPDERQLLGLRTNRLADIAAKYGDVEGSMRLRKQYGDMQYEDKVRDRQGVEWNRADTAYNENQAARDINANADVTSPEGYDEGRKKLVASGQSTALLDDRRKRGLLSGYNPEDRDNAVKVEDQLRSVDPAAAAAMAQARKLREEDMQKIKQEGVHTFADALLSGVPVEKALVDFDKTGKTTFKLNGQPTYQYNKDGSIKDVLVSGTIDGKSFSNHSVKSIRNMMDTYEQDISRKKAEEESATRAATLENQRAGLRIQQTNSDATLRHYAAEEKRADAAAATAAERAKRESTEKADTARVKASDELDKYIMGNAALYDKTDKGEVLNPERASRAREFLNAFKNGVEVVDSDGKKHVVQVDMADLYRKDPQRAKALSDRLMDQVVLHNEIEKATGKKLPPFSNLSYGEQTSEDYAKRGLNVWSALKNTLPLTDNKVIRAGDVSADYSSIVGGENGEIVKRALAGREELLRDLSEKGESLTQAARPTLRPSDNPKLQEIDSLTQAQPIISAALREAGAKGDVESVTRLTKALEENAARLRALGGR